MCSPVRWQRFSSSHTDSGSALACGNIPTGQLVAETETQVVVEAVTVGEPDGSCWILHPIRLKEPLGDRDIIDHTTGEAVPAESI